MIVDKSIIPNTVDESNNNSGYELDFLSNGFKLRGTMVQELTNQVHHTSTWHLLKILLLQAHQFLVRLDDYVRTYSHKHQE
jgi:hypothetical protein